MRKAVAIVLVNLFLALLSQAQKPDSVKIFIDSALSIMQHNSINAGQLDWTQIRDSVEMMTAKAKDYRDVQPAIQYAFNRLGDKHGWLVFADKDYKNPAFPPDTSRISNDIKQTALKGPQVYAAQIKKKIYVSLNTFFRRTNTGSDEEIWATFTGFALPLYRWQHKRIYY